MQTANVSLFTRFVDIILEKRPTAPIAVVNPLVPEPEEVSLSDDDWDNDSDTSLPPSPPSPPDLSDDTYINMVRASSNISRDQMTPAERTARDAIANRRQVPLSAAEETFFRNVIHLAVHNRADTEFSASRSTSTPQRRWRRNSSGSYSQAEFQQAADYAPSRERSNVNGMTLRPNINRTPRFTPF